MLRSSAKNFRDVTVVVTRPTTGGAGRNEGLRRGTTPQTRFRLAKKVFDLTYRYDGAISRHLEGVDFPG